MMPTVTHLFVKKTKSQPMIAATSLKLLQGYGIEGDINASAISPRQVLITRKEDLDEMSIPYGGLRENIIIEGINVNDFAPGGLIQIGENTKIRLTFHCEPCKRIADVIPSIKAIMYRRGILGVVVNGGTIAIGSTVACTPNSFKAFSEVPYERFLDFVRCVPFGRIVTYKMVATGMGVAESYIRAIPKYVEKSVVENTACPVHRIVDTAGSLINDYLPLQASMLREEQVQLISDTNLFSDVQYKVSLPKFLWRGEPIYMD